MRLTSRGEYALLALVYLARQKGAAYVPLETIAQVQHIPPKFLEQIMLILKRAHYVQSHKGQHGGYRLALAPTEITLAEIIRLCDGPLAPTESVSTNFYASTPIEREKKLIRVLRRIRDYIAGELEHTTLADIR